MASRTSQRCFAGAFKFDIVSFGNFQKMLPFLGFNICKSSVSPLELKLNCGVSVSQVVRKNWIN